MPTDPPADPPSDPLNGAPPEVAMVIRRRVLGKILSVDQIDVSQAIEQVDVPVWQVTCFDPASNVTHIKTKKFIVILRNSYQLGLLDNVMLTALAARHFRKRLPPEFGDAPRLCRAAAQHFLAEIMARSEETHLARTLFLEPMFAYDQTMRALFALKAQNTRLRETSLLFTRMAIDFITYHEFGHTAEQDARFTPFFTAALDAAAQAIPADDISPQRRSEIEGEIRCDLFSISTLFQLHAPFCSRRRLRAYGRLLARLSMRLLALPPLAQDLHAQNYAAEGQEASSEKARLSLLELQWREAALRHYINNFDFSLLNARSPVFDRFLSIGEEEDILGALGQVGDVTEPLTEHARRMAELTSQAIEGTSAFAVFRDTARTPWLFDGQYGQPQPL